MLDKKLGNFLKNLRLMIIFKRNKLLSYNEVNWSIDNFQEMSQPSFSRNKISSCKQANIFTKP